MAYQSINPYNEKLLKTFTPFSDTQLEQLVTTADAAFVHWRKKMFSERAIILIRAADMLRKQVDKFANLATLEMGKLFSEAKDEVLLSADIIDYYAKYAEQFLAPQILSPDSGTAHIISKPIGVLLGIQPWNFPYYQLARFAAPNLMAGNVVMVKHASCVPQCAIAFEKLFMDAGTPSGVYTNLIISYDQVDYMIDDPRIRGVALTGSVDAGAVVAARTGLNLKKLTLELGGNDAFIVLEDADLDQAVQWAVWGKMNNTGQCCVAAKRLILIDTIADDFIKKFQAKLSLLKAGDPMDKTTTLAPLSTKTALTKVLSQIKEAVASGAKVVLGGARIAREGYFMQPTILTNISPDNPAFNEEIFGPVALIYRVKNEDEAILLANNTSFGLGCSVFAHNVERAKEVASQIETGMVFINQATWTAADLPFGGIKNSGYGRELSSLGIQEFINKKLIRISPIESKPS